MEYVHEQIEHAKAQIKHLEEEMYMTQRRYHVFDGLASELWKATDEQRNKILRSFAEQAKDEVWEDVLRVLDGTVNSSTYDRCRKIIELGTESESECVKLLSSFVKACPHVMAHKLQGDLCLKSHECLIVDRRLDNLYMHANRAIDSYHACTTTSRTSSTQPECVL